MSQDMKVNGHGQQIPPTTKTVTATIIPHLIAPPSTKHKPASIGIINIPANNSAPPNQNTHNIPNIKSADSCSLFIISVSQCRRRLL